MTIKYIRVVCAVGLCFAALTAHAKDLYVSPSGNDSVTYEANSISSPWRSVPKAVYSLKAGDTLYMRQGTYAINYPMWLRSDYTSKTQGGDTALTMSAQSGTASAPVKVTSYPGETATLDGAGIASASTDAMFIIDDKSYWTFEKFNAINVQSGFVVVYDGSASNITFRDLTIRMSRGGDNAGAIKVTNENAKNIVIDRNTVVGPGTGVHQNTAGIWVNRLTTLKVTRNTISNVPVGIYFKHGLYPGFNPSAVDVEFAYNYIFNTERNAARFSVSYAKIHDNVFGAGNAPVDIGPSSALPNGDYNNFSHNTFLCDLGLSSEDTNSPAGAYGNTLKDNLFLKTVSYHMWKTIPHATTTTNNGFDNAAKVGELSTLYSITDWLLHSVLDLTSIFNNTNKKGAVQFTGGTAPTTLAGFKLAAGSFGTSAASDGKDFGADISAMSSGSATPAPVVPKSPTSVIVQ